VAIVALTAALLAVSIKSTRPEIAILISVSACIMIVIYCSGYLANVIYVLKEMAADINLDLSFSGIILKIVAIAYICEFSAALCKDAGEKAIASKVELAGKILILFTSSPVILAFLEMLTDII